MKPSRDFRPRGETATPKAMVALYALVWCPKCFTTLYCAPSIDSWSLHEPNALVLLPSSVVIHLAQCFGEAREAKS
jgi:hypothetical protein